MSEQRKFVAQLTDAFLFISLSSENFKNNLWKHKEEICHFGMKYCVRLKEINSFVYWCRSLYFHVVWCNLCHKINRTRHYILSNKAITCFVPFMERKCCHCCSRSKLLSNQNIMQLTLLIEYSILLSPKTNLYFRSTVLQKNIGVMR